VLRADAIAAWRAGVAAAEPRAAVERILLEPAYAQWRRPDLVIATGKAAASMARSMGDVDGFVLLPHGEPAPDLARGLRVLRGDHPIPSEQGVDASRELLRAAAALGAGQRLLYLVSGGTSALFEVPRDGISVESLIEVYRLLLGSGATIGETNLVRRALSQVKGGGLAGVAAAAKILTLAVSDVAGDDPATIGSGPTVFVDEDPADARRVLERYHLWQRVPVDVRRLLARPALRAARPRAQASEYEVVCSIASSIEAARRDLSAKGYGLLDEGRLEGDAAAAGTAVADAISRSLAAYRPAALVMGGETTVRLPESAGRGGRNQHVAAVIANRLAGREGFACAVAGTDGIDGNSDCAGALIDGGTAARARAAGHDLAGALARFDTGTALETAGDALRTGPTGTNVGDLLVALVAPASPS
jgi:hydroxypyruvate reductase